MIARSMAIMKKLRHYKLKKMALLVTPLPVTTTRTTMPVVMLGVLMGSKGMKVVEILMRTRESVVEGDVDV